MKRLLKDCESWEQRKELEEAIEGKVDHDSDSKE